MDLDFENPFADHGTIVRGERFIGREKDLQIIKNRVIRPRESGNLAIIGEPRVGKSSLVYQAIMENKADLVDQGLLPIWINIATYDGAAAFFRSLVLQSVDEMRELDLLSAPAQRAADLALEDQLSWSEGYSRIQRFFQKVRRAGIHVLFILDEFDGARTLFQADISGFQGLRELTYRPEWRVTFITTSRRTIRDIELQTKALSTLDGIFYKHYLSMFCEEDIEDYFSRLILVARVEDTDLLRERVSFYCGGHPYLLELLGYEILELFREKKTIDVDLAAHRVMQSFLTQYERIVELLREDGNLSKLLQILFGPVVDVKQTEVDELLRYGFIKPDCQGRYVAFSDHFQTFLRLVEHEVDLDLWPTWRETELALRQLITTSMMDKYGEGWIAKLEKAKSNLCSIFDRCRQAQEKARKSFGHRASANLIDFTYPQDLFAIMFAEWNLFRTTLGRDKGYWDQRAQLLAKVRNPLAHNRSEELSDYERQIADGYCKEILSVVGSTR